MLPHAKQLWNFFLQLFLTEAQNLARTQCLKVLLRIARERYRHMRPVVEQSMAQHTLTDKLAKVAKEHDTGTQGVSAGAARLMGMIFEAHVPRDPQGNRRRASALAILAHRFHQIRTQKGGIDKEQSAVAGLLDGLGGVLAEAPSITKLMAPEDVKKVWDLLVDCIYAPEDLARTAVPCAACGVFEKCSLQLIDPLFAPGQAVKIYEGLQRLLDQDRFRSDAIKSAAGVALEALLSAFAARMVEDDAGEHTELFESILNDLVTDLRAATSNKRSSAPAEDVVAKGSGSIEGVHRVRLAGAIRSLGRFAGPIRRYRGPAALLALFTEMIFRSEILFQDLELYSVSETHMASFLDAFAGFIEHVDEGGVDAVVIVSLERLLGAVFQAYPSFFDKNKARLHASLARFLLVLSGLGSDRKSVV